MLLICRHPDLITSFSHQAAGRTCAQTIDMQADSFSQAKRHLFLSFLTCNHYVTMQFPVLLYSVYKRKSISKHGRESRQVFEMVSRPPWTLTKPYKERFARDALENSYSWLTVENVSLQNAVFFACIISKK